MCTWDNFASNFLLPNSFIVFLGLHHSNYLTSILRFISLILKFIRFSISFLLLYLFFLFFCVFIFINSFLPHRDLNISVSSFFHSLFLSSFCSFLRLLFICPCYYLISLVLSLFLFLSLFSLSLLSFYLYFICSFCLFLHFFLFLYVCLFVS